MSIGKRSLWLVAAWAVATAMAAGVAWAVVGLAGDRVGEEAVQPLSAEEVAALGVSSTVSMPAGATTVPETAPASTALPELATTDPHQEMTTTTSLPVPSSTTSTTSIPSSLVLP